MTQIRYGGGRLRLGSYALLAAANSLVRQLTDSDEFNLVSQTARVASGYQAGGPHRKRLNGEGTLAERTVWEKLSTVTSFLGGVTALVAAMVAGYTLIQQGMDDDLATPPPTSKFTIVITPEVLAAAERSTAPPEVAPVAPSSSPGPSVPPAADSKIAQRDAITGWASIGKRDAAGDADLKIGDPLTFPRNTNLRTGYPRFPFYRFSERLGVAYKGQVGEILEKKTNIGAGNYTWVRVRMKPGNIP